MKRQSVTTNTPVSAIIRPLAEDRFMQRMDEFHQLVARRAYELFEESGLAHGHDLEDWLCAESQLLAPARVEIFESPESIAVKSALPGYTAADIEIFAEPRRLFIGAQPPDESEDKLGKGTASDKTLKRAFIRLDLPAPVDPEKTTATFSNGELQIELRKVKSEPKVAAATNAAA